jgi:hypothetical protein
MIASMGGAGTRSLCRFREVDRDQAAARTLPRAGAGRLLPLAVAFTSRRPLARAIAPIRAMPVRLTG